MREQQQRLRALLAGILFVVVFLCCTGTVQLDHEAEVEHHGFGRRNLIINFEDDSDLPRRSDYKLIEVCLDETFDESCTDPISFSKERDLTGSQFRYQHIGPMQIRGTFWLQVTQTSSALSALAETNGEEGRFNTGVLEEDEDGFMAMADKDRLTQVMDNLMSNASKFSGDSATT